MGFIFFLAIIALCCYAFYMFAFMPTLEFFHHLNRFYVILAVAAALGAILAFVDCAYAIRALACSVVLFFAVCMAGVLFREL